MRQSGIRDADTGVNAYIDVVRRQHCATACQLLRLLLQRFLGGHQTHNMTIAAALKGIVWIDVVSRILLTVVRESANFLLRRGSLHNGAEETGAT